MACVIARVPLADLPMIKEASRDGRLPSKIIDVGAGFALVEVEHAGGVTSAFALLKMFSGTARLA